MVVIVDDDKEGGPARRYKQASPVDLKYGQASPSIRESEINSLRDFALVHGGWEPRMKGKSGVPSRQGSQSHSLSQSLSGSAGDDQFESRYRLN